MHSYFTFHVYLQRKRTTKQNDKWNAYEKQPSDFAIEMECIHEWKLGFYLSMRHAAQSLILFMHLYIMRIISIVLLCNLFMIIARRSLSFSVLQCIYASNGLLSKTFSFCSLFVFLFSGLILMWLTDFARSNDSSYSLSVQVKVYYKDIKIIHEKLVYTVNYLLIEKKCFQLIEQGTYHD